MQRSTSAMIVTRISRSMTERIKAINKNIEALEALFNDLPNQGFANLEKNVASFALFNHANRIQRSIDDFEKQNKLTTIETMQLNEIKKRLATISNNIKINLPKVNDQKADTTIMIAGAGPVGYFSAVSLLDKQNQHHSNIVLVADKYARFPNRAGSLNSWVVVDYAIALGLGDEKDENRRSYIQRLISYITLRKQGDYGIKHIDMLGRATYQAKGGKFVSGTIDWSTITKMNNLDSASVPVSSDIKSHNNTTVPNVRCIINAMGANASYPKGIKREELSTEDNKQILRTNCAQVNVSVSPSLYSKLIELRNYYYDQNNYCFVPHFFHGYELADLPKPADRDKNFPKEEIIYVEGLSKPPIKNPVHYIVKSPTGKIIEGTIDQSEFKHGEMPKGYYQLLSSILLVTSERKQTHLGKVDKHGNLKVQLFPNLTTKENDILNSLADNHPGLKKMNGKEKVEAKIILKLQLFLEFLGKKAKIPCDIIDLNEMVLRDQIKQGKDLCREFKIYKASAPPQEIIELPETRTVATWVGAAALPTILNGQFVWRGVTHAESVIKHLVDHDFKTGKLDDNTQPGILYKKWIEDVNSFINNERSNSKDMSDEMKEYFSKKLGAEHKSGVIDSIKPTVKPIYTPMIKNKKNERAEKSVSKARSEHISEEGVTLRKK